MSRRISWLVIAIAVFVTLAVIVYSRQAPAGRRQGPAVKQMFAEPQQRRASAEQTPTPANENTPKETCSLSLAQAPDIGGIRLGMTLEEVLALFPGSKENSEVRVDLGRPASQLGETSLVINPEAYESGSKFPGAKQIAFTLLDGRVSNFTVGYNGPKWKHVDEFVAKFSEGRNLPAAWEGYVGMDTALKSLKCDGFEISVFAGGKNGSANNVRINDLVADRKLKERRAKAIEKAEKAAKP
jgi:hypothetical protein